MPTTNEHREINMKPIKVLLADDHAIVRMGLASLLGTKDDIEVVGEAEDGEESPPI